MNTSLSYTREYNIWSLMRQRCGNPKAENFKSYGGRGITVCERWGKFANFYSDMGPAPSLQHTIDRIDNKLGYTPENCRWADRETQQNNRSTTIHITAFGETHSRVQWARKTGLSVDQILHRIEVMRMTPEQALTAPRMSWVQREVIQMDMTGTEIARFPTHAAAKKLYGPGVWNVLSGRAKTAYGFKWKYVPDMLNTTNLNHS